MQTILMEDDPRLFRDLEDSLLRRRALRLLTAGSEEDLLRRTRQEQPDLVVLGPGCSQETAARLRQGLASLPRPPLCLHCPRPGAGSALLEEMHRHLGMARRTDERLACRVTAHVTAGGETRRGVTRDVAAGGIYVASREPFQASTEVQVRLRSAAGATAEAAGQVLRAVTPDDAGEHLSGMAIGFGAGHALDSACLAHLAAGAGTVP